MKSLSLNTRKLVISGLMCAFVTVLTLLSIEVPTGIGAFIHFGDAIVLTIGYFLGGWYCALSAGIGSLLADFLLGSPIYAPATLLIKALMALTAHAIIQKLGNKKYWLAFIVAGAIMPIGYFLYEWVLFSFPIALADIPYNLIQYAAGVVVAGVLIFALNRINIKGID